MGFATEISKEKIKENEIGRKAFWIWEKAGRPHGRQVGGLCKTIV